MLPSILVGLDGSDTGRFAEDLGLQWAKRFDSLLVGIGVVDEPAIRGSQPEGRVNRSYKPVYDQLLAADRRRVEQVLERFTMRCGEENVACKLLEDEGTPCDRLVAAVQRYDLLMLGCRTHFSYGCEGRPCKTLELVMRNTPRPVVLAPQAPIREGGGVVVAYDGSVQAGRALQAFLATGLESLGPVSVVTVHSESQVDAARTADVAVEFLRFHQVAAQRVALVDQAKAKAFIDFARQENAALIVMGVYGQPRMKEFFFGSATRMALKESPIPLFIYH